MTRKQGRRLARSAQLWGRTRPTKTNTDPRRPLKILSRIVRTSLDKRQTLYPAYKPSAHNTSQNVNKIRRSAMSFIANIHRLGRNMGAERSDMEKACEHCGSPVVGKRADARFCSRACRRAAKWARYPTENKLEQYRRVATKRKFEPRAVECCQNCMGDISHRPKNARYCSDACRHASYWRRHITANRARRLAWHYKNREAELDRMRLRDRAHGPSSAIMHIAHTMKHFSKEKPDDQP